MIENRLVTIGCLVGAIICILLSIISGSVVAVIISSFLFIIGLIVWRYGYLLIPMLTKATKIVEVREGYQISPERNSLLKQTINGWSCTKVMEMVFYSSATVSSDNEKHHMFESFEKMLSSFSYPVKISLVIAPVDLTSYIDGLKTQRSRLEAKLSSLDEKSIDYRTTERKIKLISSTIDKIMKGEKPLEVIAYVSTTAIGTTPEEAESTASRQVKEISTIVGSTLNCDVRELKDRDLITALGFEYAIPDNAEALRDRVF